MLLLVLDLFINNAPAEVRAEHPPAPATGRPTSTATSAACAPCSGDRYDQIRDHLPELLDRYGRMRATPMS